MKTYYKLFLLIFLILFSLPIDAQQQEYSEYYFLRRNYEGLLENDPNAIHFINQYILKAKKEKDYPHLIQGYLDGILYSPSPYNKLKFADSTIYASKLTGDNDKISAAYLEKGVVYYFQFKKYNLALDEYLKAYKYSKDSKDEFYKNRLTYLMAVVNSYIGNYSEAIEQLKGTSTFFRNESKKAIHSNLVYNNLRGYYNSIHQMAVCYRKIGNYKLADSLIELGLSQTASSKEYMQEYGYFLKEKGIQQFNNKNYSQAILSLTSSTKSILTVNDFATVTVCYSYLGKSYLALGNSDLGVSYFQKVDSVFQKYNFILPEVRDNYESLIDYYNSKRNIEKQYYYIKQLLKADRVLNTDFENLNSKIHKEYDPPLLLEMKTRLERRSILNNWIYLLIISGSVSIILLLIFRNRKKQKNLLEKYSQLEKQILDKSSNMESETRTETEPEIGTGTELEAKGETKSETEKEHQPEFKQELEGENQSSSKENKDFIEIEPDTMEIIIRKLKNFEKNKGYLDCNLNSNNLAEQLNTNSKYLSSIIKQYWLKDYRGYINELRINYITQKIYKDRKFHAYTIKSLSEEAGFATSANFSKQFLLINGMKIRDFINQRKRDLNYKDESSEDVTL